MRSLVLLLAVPVLSGCPKPPQEDPKAKADGLYLAATQAYLMGDFKQAHALFDQVQQLNPADPRLPAAQGEVFLAEVKLDQALEKFIAAEKLEPGRATTHSRLGFIYELKGQHAEAKAELEKAIGLNPRDFNAHETLGDMALKQKDAPLAVKHFLLASEAAPDPARAELVLRAVQALVEKPLEALEVLERAVRQGIVSGPLWNELGDRLVQVSRLVDAVKAYSEAAKVTPTDPTLWELVGELQSKLDKPAEAELAFRESLKIADRAVVHVALARLCQQRKDEPCVKQEVDLALEKATGEEVRETIELAALLSSRGKGKEAFVLLSALAREPEQQGNGQVQLEAARLAKQQKDAAAVKQFCAAAHDAGITRCP